MRILLGRTLQSNEQFYRHTLESAGHTVGLDNHSQKPEADSVVAIMTLHEFDSELSELRKLSVRVLPVLVGDLTSLHESVDLILASAPILPVDTNANELLRIIEFVSRGDGWLRRELVRIDENARQIAGNDICEWVRSRHGIIGILRFARADFSLLGRLVKHSYALLDDLAREQFSVQDVWNVTLLIAVPVKRADRQRMTELDKSLDQISRDLSGARKVVLWLDEGVRDHFGPLTLGHNVRELPDSDPLRATIARLATDFKERDALEVIFKSRLSQEDIDHLMKVLGRQS